MARILCNVAGGGKPLKGNAGPGDVLAGKTFSNKQSNALTGSMPNNGTNKNAVSVGGGSGSLYAYMPYGYYDNYNNSGNAWINITNDQAKTLANNAGVGYNRGVSDADGRVNTSSASYNSGYAKGANDKQATNRYKEVAVASEAHGWSMGALIANSNGQVINYGNTSTVNGNYMTIHCGDTCYITARVNGYFIPQGGSRGYYNSGSTIVSTTVAEGHYGAVIAVAVD